MASRAHLLSGLRTGGPRSSSPFEGDSDASPATKTLTLKANATPFTPTKRLSSGPVSVIEGQAALRMQQTTLAAALQRQASHSIGEDFAAAYGAAQGQPQQVDYQQQEMANLIRQKQAQLLQNQMIAQQQQQQMEMYRLQAASQQQQHLQQVAAQQRILLAQMQAEYNQQQNPTQDQRMPAQASLEASMRQRRAEQVYIQLMEQQQQSQMSEEAQMQQQQQLLQRLQLLQMQAAAMQTMQDVSFGDDSPAAMSTPIRRNVSPRSDSPSVAQQNRRDRQASQTAADNATSWRSTPSSLSKASKLTAGRKTPSIVVDDSASDKSDAENSISEDNNETPETSEEDISDGVNALVKEVNQKLSVEKRESSISPKPRPLALSQAPRTRAFSTDVKTNTPSNGVAVAVNIASRQPRGPPTEFLSINFTSRLSARTRREAMSKLCASPRAASFNMISRSAIVA